MSVIELSLASHTNVGKTSLMRTLLRADIGEVADRPHVTERAEGHVLIESSEGDVLRLWDTPGFGDSTRLLKRLLASGNPLGWLQSQVWDRFTDRPFYSSQQAVRNVRDKADVVLYLVNAAEDAAAAAYVQAEMRILGWIGKPVLVLLNQTGPARTRDADARDEAAWRARLAEHVGAFRVIALDAFARCWVQEDRLLGAVQDLVPPEKGAAFSKLRAAWRQRNLEVFASAMQVTAGELAFTATDREPIGDGKPERAMAALGRRLADYARAGTERLIELHGLEGRASARILERLASHYEVSRPADVRKTGIVGGMVSGALGGLTADLAAGGLTLGAGLIVGAILGGLGAGGAAHAYNVISGAAEGRVRWSAELLGQTPATALLRYLAVAHYGRARGEWAESEYPAHWRTLVDTLVEERRAAFEDAWSAAAAGMGSQELSARLQPPVTEAAREALVRLYPESEGIWAGVVKDRP